MIFEQMMLLAGNEKPCNFVISKMIFRGSKNALKIFIKGVNLKQLMTQSLLFEQGLFVFYFMLTQLLPFCFSLCHQKPLYQLLPY